MHWQSPCLLLFQCHCTILILVEILKIIMLFLTPKQNSVNVLLIFNALAISLPPSVPM